MLFELHDYMPLVWSYITICGTCIIGTACIFPMLHNPLMMRTPCGGEYTFSTTIDKIFLGLFVGFMLGISFPLIMVFSPIYCCLRCCKVSTNWCYVGLKPHIQQNPYINPNSVFV
jgi:hypothetical protein